MKIDIQTIDNEKRFVFKPEKDMDVYILGQLHQILRKENIDFTLGVVGNDIQNIHLKEKDFIKYIINTI